MINFYTFTYHTVITCGDRLAKQISNDWLCSKTRQCTASLNTVNSHKYLIGRFMFRIYQGQVHEFLSPFFVRSCDTHQYETRLADHFCITLDKLDLGKTGIKYK